MKPSQIMAGAAAPSTLNFANVRRLGFRLGTPDKFCLEWDDGTSMSLSAEELLAASWRHELPRKLSDCMLRVVATWAQDRADAAADGVQS